jgi:predicted nucleotidyltransferase
VQSKKDEYMPGSLIRRYEDLVKTLYKRSAEFYGDRLNSFVIFGSVGRRAMRPDSDIDFLLIVNGLPRGRLRRIDEFETVEKEMRTHLEEASRNGVYAQLSPVFKTPAEVCSGSPLFLDMVDDSWILYDRESFFQKELDLIRGRLKRLGAQRIWKGNAWYWDLKPDYKYGDEFEI